VLKQIGDRIAAGLAAQAPWTNVYGVARTLLACGTLLTLLFSPVEVLFHPMAGRPDFPTCTGPADAGWFCVADGHLQLARWLAIAALVLVASGWRPRFTGILHWYVAWSVHSNVSLVDGGDQVTTVLTLLMIPLTLTDARKWHWQPMPAPATARPIAALVAISTVVALRLQVAMVYFHAAIGKLAVDEWVNGTATYYFFSDPMFGTPSWLSWLSPVLTTPIGVALVTWLPLLLEFLLAASIVMERRWWRPLLVAGLAFHAAIALNHGLVSFALAMWGALILLLRPKDQPFVLPAFARKRVALLAMPLLGASGCAGEASPPEDPCEKMRFTADRLVAHRATPGILASYVGDDVECHMAAGLADIDGVVGMREGARFRVGSVTKSMVAAAVLQLEAEGKLALDDKVADYTDLLEDGDRIEIRHLLNHTSGLVDYTLTEDYWGPTITDHREWRPQQLIAIAEDFVPWSEPGEAYNYSSTNYIVLGVILQIVDDEPLPDIMQRRVFDPLSLAHTRFETTWTADIVRGYEPNEDGFDDVSDVLHPSGTWAAGAITTSAADLHTFLRAYREGDIAGNYGLFTQASEMLPTGQTLYPSYGYGLISRRTKIGNCLGHDGHLPGYASLAFYCPDADASLVILGNRDFAELDDTFDAMLEAAID
jgi:sporulation delaying protein B